MKPDDTDTRYANWYAKLLRLYPKPYQERFSQPMEQTFNDLYAEQNKTRISLFSFTLWAFTETAAGIIKERMQYMKSSNKPLVLSVIVGLLAVLPFMAMELITASDKPRSNFGLPMFIVMWLFAVVFIVILLSVVKSYQARKKAKINPMVIGLKVVVLAVIAWSWVSLIIDQMPCFLGASGC